jgi:hypothetical protein
MFSQLNEAVNKLMDGFFQQQEENQRLNKRCDELQNELRDMKARLLLEHEEFEGRIEAASKSFKNLTLDDVLVGFDYTVYDEHIYDDETPIHIKKQSECSVFEALCDGVFGDDVSNYKFCLILESFRYFDPIFDLAQWSKFGFLDVCYEGKDLYCSERSLEDVISNPDNQLKDLFKVCKELGIKFVVNGSDSVNGVPIDKILS